MNQFLTEKNFWNRYNKAVTWTKQWSDPFDEYERIARNGVEGNIPEEYARIADGTTAALIRKTPKRIIQQLPTGAITSDDDNDWLPIVASFILFNKIIPYANASYDLIQKFWSTVEHGLTVGGQAVYTPFVKHGNEFTADASLIYWGDIFFQPGKKSFYDCDYFFMRSWWQPETIDEIVQDDKQRAKIAKEHDVEYESTWDIKALKEAKKHYATKDEQAKTSAEERLGVDAAGIEVVIGFQKGLGAMFYTGCPNGTDGVIVRRKKNRDPRGLPPVDYYYSDVDDSNPFGRSVIELVGGMQNMIDSDLRSYQFNRALMLSPPLQVFGNVDTTQAFYSPSALIEMGSSPNNAIKPLAVDTSAITNYPNIYALNKTQLYALFNSGGDTTVSAEVGNPGFGKTPTALKQQKELMSADDNYIRKNFESFFENWAETAVNTYFAEREGVEELQLDQKTADELRQLEESGKLETGFVDDNNKIKIDYSTATSALRFRVDASTSKLNGQSEQLEALQLLLQIASTPILTQIISEEKIAACWNKIVANSGVEDPEDLSIDMQQFTSANITGQSEDTATTTPPQNQLEVPASTQDTDSTENMVAVLRAQGVPDNLIIQATQAIKSGTPPEQVAENLERLIYGR